LAPLDEGAIEVLTALRWPSVAQSAEPAAVLLASRLSARVREMLLAGREVVLIANSEHALVDPEQPPHRSDRHNFPRMQIRKREGTPWDGRWMGAFAWRRTDDAWSALPGGPLLDEHWCGLTPNFVLTGFLSTAYTGLIDAGVVVGWLQASAAFTKSTRLGPGQLTVTSFEFRSPGAAAHPLAPLVLAAGAAG
jgi:hypothetical protein